MQTHTPHTPNSQKLCKYYQQAPMRHFRCMHHTYSATRSQQNKHFLQHPTWFPPPKPPILIPPPSSKKKTKSDQGLRESIDSFPPAESWGPIKQGKFIVTYYPQSSLSRILPGQWHLEAEDNTAFVDVPISYWVKFDYSPWDVQKGLLLELE